MADLLSVSREDVISWLTTSSFTGFELTSACFATFAFSLVLFYTVWAMVPASSASINPEKGPMGNNADSKGEEGDDATAGEEEDDEEEEEEEESEFEADPSLPLLSKTAGPGEWKMVLCVRTDLEMTKGKAAAQCCHATLASVRRIEKTDTKGLTKWERYGQAKVTLKCPNEEEMLNLQKKARAMGLVAESIRDAGRTQIAANSRTVLAVGPGPKKLIDEVTGHLKLY